MDNDLRLYILMRTDLADLNPGKAVAQGSHAANQCIATGRVKALEDDDWPRGVALESSINDWEDQTGAGFGTCIVLGVDEATLWERVAKAAEAGVHAGITHDPSYPTGTPPRTERWPLRMGLLFLAAIASLAIDRVLWPALLLALAGTADWVMAMVLADRRQRQRAAVPATIPLDTCGFIFGPKAKLAPFVEGLDLMA